MPTEGTGLRWSPPDREPARQDESNLTLESSEAETSVTELKNNLDPLPSWVTVKNESQSVDFSLELIDDNSQTNSLLPHRIIESSSSFLINSLGISDNFNESLSSESQDVGFSVELSENKSQIKILPHEHQEIEQKIASRENPDSSTLRDVTPSPQSSPTHDEQTENNSNPKTQKSRPLPATPQPGSDAEEQGERSRERVVQLSSSDAVPVAFTDSTDNLRFTEQSSLTTDDRQRPSQLPPNPRSQLTTTELPNFLVYQINRLNETKEKFPPHLSHSLNRKLL